MLSIKNLTFWYDNINIIDKFSYKFQIWKIYGIFWKSWLWKSTLARLISWFLKPIDWFINIDNKEIKNPSKEIVYVNQKDDIFYRLTVYENLCLICNDKNKIYNILNKIGLYDYKDRFPKELSWWMLKRLSFSRILILNPKVLILDEPFVHLDVKSKWNLIDLLLETHKENNTMIIILISHSLNEMKITDKILSFEESISWNYKSIFIKK